MRYVAALCGLLLAALLTGPVVTAQERDIGAHGELLDRIAAVVNDGLVLKSELDEQMEAVTKRLQEQKVELPPESVLRQQVLERLILQEIQTQRAKHVGLTISDEQLNGALQEIAQRNKIPFDQLPTALGAQGVDYKQYRESMRKELTLNTLRQRDVIAHINVSPHELEQYLARQQSAASNDEFNVSHILLSPRRRTTSPRGRPRVRTSPSSRSPTRTARRPSTAASSVGARARSCRSSFSTS
jgi:peptidyl-prolyl cis-trans isomerase SurA